MDRLVSRGMTTDEPDAIARYNLDEPEDDLPERSYWWSLHRPETYALTALGLAVASLLTLGPAQEIAQAIILSGSHSEKALLLTLSGIRLGMSLLAILCAAISVRSEDEDTTWSAPVARAGLLLATLAALMSIGSLITVGLLSGDPNNGF